MELIKTGRSTLCISDSTDVRKLLTLCDAYVSPLLSIRPELVVYGKKCNQNRNVSFFSNASSGYTYSGTKSHSMKLNDSLFKLLEYVNNRFNACYNGILVNKYIDGKDYIGAHSDSEIGLDVHRGVICVSTGVLRKFRIRGKLSKKIICDIETLDFIQMKGDFQNEFTHEIPKQLKVKGERVSYTFRYHRT